GDIDACGALQQQPRLNGGKLAAADYERRLAVEAHQDGEGPHRYPPTTIRSGGASARLSGASSTSSPSSSGIMMIWQQSRERSPTWKAPSSISSSSAEGGTSLSTQSSPTHTWHVAQAQAPPHSALMGMPQSRITSMPLQPSRASSRCVAPSGIRTVTNMIRRP